MMNKITIPVLQESKSSRKPPRRGKDGARVRQEKAKSLERGCWFEKVVCMCYKHRIHSQDFLGSESGPTMHQLFELKKVSWKFSGGSVVRDLGFHCQGPKFNPRLGELRSHKLCGTTKKKKKKKERKFLNSFVPQLSHLKLGIGTSFVVQWLRHCAPIAGGMRSVPGQETRIPHTTGLDLKKKCPY